MKIIGITGHEVESSLCGAGTGMSVSEAFGLGLRLQCRDYFSSFLVSAILIKNLSRHRKGYIFQSLFDEEEEVSRLKEIRIHGRGGQGSVTAAELIAIAAFEDKRFSQAFPAFGVERRGAPVMAFVRIADKPIRIRSQVYEPNYVVVQDVSLLEVVNVASGLKPDGKIIINTDKPKDDLNLKTEAEVVTIDATKIAMETLGRPIVNTIMLGAFCKATKEVSLESINKAISERFKGELGKKNLLAIKAASEKVA